MYSYMQSLKREWSVTGAVERTTCRPIFSPLYQGMDTKFIIIIMSSASSSILETSSSLPLLLPPHAILTVLEPNTVKALLYQKDTSILQPWTHDHIDSEPLVDLTQVTQLSSYIILLSACGFYFIYNAHCSSQSKRHVHIQKPTFSCSLVTRLMCHYYSCMVL